MSRPVGPQGLLICFRQALGGPLRAWVGRAAPSPLGWERQLLHRGGGGWGDLPEAQVRREGEPHVFWAGPLSAGLRGFSLRGPIFTGEETEAEMVDFLSCPTHAGRKGSLPSDGSLGCRSVDFSNIQKPLGVAR